jgi:CMP-N,N'-diacetyllegionaminic acid synthase
MKLVVIIPARGGSKSLPKKNILLLRGMPLLCHSVDYSLKSKLVSTTIVSTDSQEIADIAKNCGAKVPFIRPSEFAQDDSRDYQVMRHALDFLEAQGNIFDLYILLRPTSPMRPPGLIEKAVEILEKNTSATSVRSMARIKEHPYRAWRQHNDGSVSGFVYNEIEPYNIPRQELPELYFQTGDIEVIRREVIIKGSISGERVFPLVIDHEDMIDIDNQSDFTRAEKLNVEKQ